MTVAIATGVLTCRGHCRVQSSIEVFLVQGTHRRALPEMVIGSSIHSVLLARALSTCTGIGSGTADQVSDENFVHVSGSIAEVIGRKSLRSKLTETARSLRERRHQVLLSLILCVPENGLRMEVVSLTRRSKLVATNKPRPPLTFNIT